LLQSWIPAVVQPRILRWMTETVEIAANCGDCGV
jgi:hypothetical protein